MTKPPARQPGSQERAGEGGAEHPVAVHPAFAEGARAVLGKCRAILGAAAGFVALRTAGEAGYEVALLEPAGLTLDRPSHLPAPLHRLCVRAAEAGRPVFSNSLSKSPPIQPSAGRLPPVRSALVAPIVLSGEVAGIVGLLDKPSRFSRADCRLAEVLAEMGAVAMRNSLAVDVLEEDRDALAREVRQGATHLRQAEETFQRLVENLPDMVARFDRNLRVLYISPVVERLSGRRTSRFTGRTSCELGLPPALVGQWDAALRGVIATGLPEVLELAFPAPDGMRHFDCRLVPELGPGGEVASVLSVARDVTDRRLAYEAEQRARSVADALREATVALTRSLDRETVLATLLDRLGRMVSFDRASVMLVEKPPRLSVRAVFDGGRVVPFKPEARPELDATEHPIVHDILRNGTAVLIPDVRARPDWSLPTEEHSEVCWMGIPLFARGDVAGLFSLSKREPGYFNQEHVQLAEAMSSQASVAVENAILYEQMQASTERMQSLSRRLVEVQENERRRIARELHDEAGHALVSLRFGLRLLEREIDAGGSVGGRVGELVQRTDAVIDGLHRLAADLRPVSLDHLGLEAALRHHSGSAASELGLVVRFKARGFTNERLPAAVETALYRVAQEAMANVARHARATRADVLVEHRGDRVLLMVEDDGVGFEPELVQGDDQIGLIGMRERAEALGGTLTIESAPGEGTTVVVEVPSADPHPDR
jgi:PAS domain S-box-containing protein